jgi:hypothetical protein
MELLADEDLFLNLPGVFKFEDVKHLNFLEMEPPMCSQLELFEREFKPEDVYFQFPTQDSQEFAVRESLRRESEKEDVPLQPLAVDVDVEEVAPIRVPTKRQLKKANELCPPKLGFSSMKCREILNFDQNKKPVQKQLNFFLTPKSKKL